MFRGIHAPSKAQAKNKDKDLSVLEKMRQLSQFQSSMRKYVFHKIKRMEEPVRETTKNVRKNLAKRDINIENEIDILEKVNLSKSRKDFQLA